MRFLWAYSLFIYCMAFMVSIQERMKNSDKYPKDVQNLNIIMQIPILIFFVLFLFGFDVQAIDKQKKKEYTVFNQSAQSKTHPQVQLKNVEMVSNAHGQRLQSGHC